MKKIINCLLVLIMLSGCASKDTGEIIEVSKETDNLGSGLIVDFIDVGQGDSSLINCDGSYMLIDGGPGSASKTIYTILNRLGIDKLDYIVASHPHSDHIGGLASALQASNVDTVLSPVVQFESSYFADFISELNKQDVSITVPQVNDTYKLGGCEFTILSVESDNEDVNNTSIVLQLNYGNTSFLFPGDIETDIERQLVADNKLSQVNVLKMSHHGSSDAIYSDFINIVEADYSIISCAGDNEYGHPHIETIDMLKQMDTTVLRTDIGGDIGCISDGNTVACNYIDQVSFDIDIQPYTNSKDSAEYNYANVDIDLDEVRTYIGNINSKTYHDVNCDYLPSKDNQVYFDSAREAQEAGYQPHYSCINNKEEY